jgi:hypothetical protein
MRVQLTSNTLCLAETNQLPGEKDDDGVADIP